MSSKQVMSHDPLAGDDEEIVGDVPAVPDGLAIPNPKEKAAGEGVLILPDVVTIADVGNLSSELVSLLMERGVVSIDASAVESIDGAGLQLLAAFIKDLVGKSSVVTWLEVSDVLRASAVQLGLSGALQLDKTSDFV